MLAALIPGAETASLWNSSAGARFFSFNLEFRHKGEASALKGRFAGRAIKAVSIEAMNEAIAAEASLRHTRGNKR